MSPTRRMLVFALLISLFPTTSATARSRKKEASPPPVAAAPAIDPAAYQGLAWRNLGPTRGGRVTAVAGVASQPTTYYMGSTGGGVWKTTDAGLGWVPVTDGQIKTGSVGAIAVAPSDPNVVYVGMGESPVRGVATSHGDGIYRSTDAGKSWTHLGLDKTRQISRIAVHPGNPDLVYVAAQGSPWAATPERGIYRSTDGGKTWSLIHHVSSDAGASDLSLDATNPRILYAAYWDHRRTPWNVRSGGPGSGLWRSKDGGDSWEKLSEGLPKEMGKVRVAASPARPDRVWAMIEAEEGGLYRSDDGGKTWQRLNQERVLRGRAWYYTHVIADPKDADTVYVLNAPMLKSIDGGRNFRPVRTPHGDNHALWINPNNSDWMINGNDGGANVSVNGGASWSTQMNQPTAQFYRVSVDQLTPYTVYGGQQDNTSVAIKSASEDGFIGPEDFREVGGCETAYVAFDPKNPVLIYAGCYHGAITEYDTQAQKIRDIQAYPVIGLASKPLDRKYRFNWNAPIVASPHDPKTLYHGAQKLLRSRDRGNSWEEISPDLTSPDPAKLGDGGGPITNEGAGGEVYQTIFYLQESRRNAGEIWVGTDNGHVHLTRDAGAHWTEVTPPGLGETQINSIEVSPHRDGTAWVVATRYKFNDFTPRILRTDDYGATWRQTTAGLPEGSFVRVVREDTARAGLLYAGTETGVFVSFDGGEAWLSLQLELPVVPITDMVLAEDDLVISTQGRAFWVLDNLTPLRQATVVATEEKLRLLTPQPAVLLNSGEGGGGRRGGGAIAGANPPFGALIDYWLAEEATPEGTELKLEILDASGLVVRKLSSKQSDKPAGPASEFGPPPPQPLPGKKGGNRWAWDLRRDGTERVKGLWGFNGLIGPRVTAGSYQVRLTLGDKVLSQTETVVDDPRSPSPSATVVAEHQQLALAVYGAIDGVYKAVNRMREVRSQVEALTQRAKTAAQEGGNDAEDNEVSTAGDELVKDLKVMEEELVQVKTESFQDIINFPNRLDAELGALLEAVDGSGPPLTAGMKLRWQDLDAEWQAAQAKIAALLGERVVSLNQLVAKKAVPAITVPNDKP